MFKRKEEENVEEGILSMVEEGHEQGVIEETEVRMIHNILDFDDKYAREIMSSRNKIFALQKDMPIDEALPLCLETHYTRYPIYDEDIDSIVGVLHLKDLVKAYLENPDNTVETVTEKAMFIHPTFMISKLLKKMQSEKIHMAVVVDEYGQTDGIVTMEDVLEEIVGNILDEHDNEMGAVSKAVDDSYIIDGFMSLNDVEELLSDIEFPDKDIETLNGFLLYSLGRLPNRQAIVPVDYGGYRFLPIDISGNVIRKVKVTKLSEVSE